MKQSQAHPVHEMMGGNVEATQRGAIAAEMVEMLTKVLGGGFKRKREAR